MRKFINQLSDVETEKQIIGIMLYEGNDRCSEGIKWLKNDFDIFTNEKCRLVYECIYELYNTNIPIDILTVSKQIHQKKLYTIVCDKDLVNFTLIITSSAHFNYHLAILRELFIKRKVLIQSMEWQESLKNDIFIDAFDLVNKIKSDIDSLVNVSSIRSYKDFLINPFEKIDDEQECILKFNSNGRWIDGLHSGDFSLLTGKQKSKKTFFASLIAKCFALNRPIDDVISPNVDSGFVYFDTEQGKKYAKKTAYRIMYNADISKVHYLNLRELDPYDRRMKIEEFIADNPTTKIGVIDGLVDLLYDFNDQEESYKCLQWLMRITKQYDIHLIGILHQNKDIRDKNPRGHLGSMILQKAELVMSIEKNPDNHAESFIEAMDSRGEPFEKFTITIDNNGVPHLISANDYFITQI